MINISRLPVITTTEEFFDCDKVLYLDFLAISGITDYRIRRALLLNQANCFTRGRDTYYLLTLKGSPENLILHAKNGVPFPVKGASPMHMSWKIDLQQSIRDEKIYDLSAYAGTTDYRKNRFGWDSNFIADRYLTLAN